MICLKEPAVSVVVPLYNKERYIRRTLDSVLAQSFQNFEVIIVNDGSTDAGPEIARQYDDPRMRVIDQENAGVSAARNRGVEQATADLIAFLDADDEWKEPFLSTIVLLSQEYCQAGAFATAYWWGTGGSDSEIRRIPGYGDTWHGIMPDFFSLRLGTLNSSVTAVRRSVFEKTGLFPTRVKMGEDLDMWIRIAVYYPIAYSNRPLAIRHYDDPNGACRRVLPESTSPYVRSLAMIESDDGLDTSVKTRVSEFIAAQRLREIAEFYRKGQPKVAVDLLSQWRETHAVCLRWIGYRLFVMLPWCIYDLLRRAGVRTMGCRDTQRPVVGTERSKDSVGAVVR